jgi:hypothetical protein
VRPDARQVAARELVDLVVGHAVPLVDHQRVERGVVRPGAGGDVDERHRLVQVVRDLRVVVEVGLQHVAAEGEGEAHVVAVVVVRDVVAPVDERRGRDVRVRRAIVPEVDHPVPAVHFQHRRDEGDDVLPDAADHRRVLDGQPVGELHQHLRASRLRRVHGPRRVVERLPLIDQLLRLGIADLARIGEARGDVAVAVERGQVLLAGDGDEHHLPPLLGLPDEENLDTRRGRRQRAHVAVDVLRVGELPLRPGDVPMMLQRRRHGGRGGQVVH